MATFFYWMDHIRLKYEKLGAEEYYRQNGDIYENPHYPQVKALVMRNYARWNCPQGAILDFCAGGGEVTLALRERGHQQLAGSDPFTYHLYEKNTGLPCLRLSFEDLIKGANAGQYALIISSFALHLCPEKDLFPVTWALFSAAPILAIITPHKRPQLEQIPGVRLLWEDAELTDRGKKVRLKVYDMPLRGEER